MTEHPTRKKIEQLFAGELPHAEEIGLMTHFELCTLCKAAFTDLLGEVSLPGLERVTLPIDPECMPLLERLKACGPPPRSVDTNIDESGTNVPSLPGYNIVRVIGRGAMGVVYLARKSGSNHEVAIKVVGAGRHVAPTHLKRFRFEVEAAARMKHPNIVRLLHIGEHDGLPFFTMEYVSGGSLFEKLKGTPQNPRHAARMVEKLAYAVDYAHKEGIVHRDLKPSNVLLAKAENEKNGVAWGSPDQPEYVSPMISDFGLAKNMSLPDTATGAGTMSEQPLGTPLYMAPEQAQGQAKRAGPAADIYALGVILYEILTGQPPFCGQGTNETLQKVIHVDPVSPDRARLDVPRDLATICLKCLRKEPKDRYPSALHLAQDLQRFLEGKPIVARQVSSAERLWMWGKRNRKYASLVAVVSLLVTALFGSLWLGSRQREQLKVQGEQAKLQDEAAKKSAAKIKGDNENADWLRCNYTFTILRDFAGEIHRATLDPSGSASDEVTAPYTSELRQQITKLQRRAEDRDEAMQVHVTLLQAVLANAERRYEFVREFLNDEFIQRAEALGLGAVASEQIGDALIRSNEPRKALERYHTAELQLLSDVVNPEGSSNWSLPQWSLSLRIALCCCIIGQTEHAIQIYDHLIADEAGLQNEEAQFAVTQAFLGRACANYLGNDYRSACADFDRLLNRLGNPTSGRNEELYLTARFMRALVGHSMAECQDQSKADAEEVVRVARMHFEHGKRDRLVMIPRIAAVMSSVVGPELSLDWCQSAASALHAAGIPEDDLLWAPVLESRGAILHERLRKPKEAIPDLSNAVRIFEKANADATDNLRTWQLAGARINYGLALIGAREFTDAADVLGKSATELADLIALNPPMYGETLALAHVSRGLAYYGLGQAAPNESDDVFNSASDECGQAINLLLPLITRSGHKSAVHLFKALRFRHLANKRLGRVPDAVDDAKHLEAIYEKGWVNSSTVPNADQTVSEMHLYIEAMRASAN